jgi:hypothetical protein
VGVITSGIGKGYQRAARMVRVSPIARRIKKACSWGDASSGLGLGVICRVYRNRGFTVHLDFGEDNGFFGLWFFRSLLDSEIRGDPFVTDPDPHSDPGARGERQGQRGQ